MLYSPRFSIFLLLGFMFLASCSNIPIKAPEIGPENDKVQRDIDAAGRLGGGDGLFNELLRGKKGGDGAGIGVNAYLWQASLDTLSFIPLASADSFGGIIITNWYRPDADQQYRYKVHVYIVGRELRSQALRVVSFKQKYSAIDQSWIDIGENKAVNNQLEESILTRARQMRIDAQLVVQ